MANRHVDAHANCIETVNHPKIKVSDPGTGQAAILQNPDRKPVRRIKMDQCLAPVNSIAADWIVSKSTIVDVIVELKGADVPHAVDQIEATLRFWLRHAAYENGQQIGAWILCSEYPRASSKVAHYRERFRARGRILVISTHNGEERQFTDFLPRNR